MKYYFGLVTTQYDGYEWGHPTCISAENEAEAREKIDRTDFTHANGVEVQYPCMIREISKEEYDVLRRYI